MCDRERTDWLRHLYSEQLNWFPGQIRLKRNELKYAVLTDVLRENLPVCWANGLVPKHYKNEVILCWNFLQSGHWDVAEVQQARQRRQLAVTIMELCSFREFICKEVRLVLSKSQKIPEMMTTLEKLMHMARDVQGQPIRSRTKEFKLKDWLLHLRRRISSWLKENTKLKKKSKLDILRHEMRPLLQRCLNNELLPPNYVDEVSLAWEGCCRGLKYLKGTATTIQRHETARKASLKLEEVAERIQSIDDNELRSVLDIIGSPYKSALQSIHEYISLSWGLQEDVDADLQQELEDNLNSECPDWSNLEIDWCEIHDNAEM